MKTIFTLVATFLSLSVLAGSYQVQDVQCGTFGFYPKKPCMLIIGDSTLTAGVLLESKYVMTKVSDVKELIGKNVEVDLDSLLMVTLEEEELIRGFINYPEASYYSATSKEFIFTDL